MKLPYFSPDKLEAKAEMASISSRLSRIMRMQLLSTFALVLMFVMLMFAMNSLSNENQELKNRLSKLEQNISKQQDFAVETRQYINEVDNELLNLEDHIKPSALNALE